MTIFYWTTKGTPAARPIYGVHPSGQPVRGGVPEGVASFEVTAPPAGCEHTHVVNATGGTPQLILDPALDARVDADADAAFNDKAVKALAEVLGLSLGLTSSQIRTRFRAAWRTL